MRKGTGIPQAASMQLKPQLTITHQDIKASANSGSSYFAVVSVEYRDIFRRLRKTNSCFHFTPFLRGGEQQAEMVFSQDAEVNERT